MEKDIIGRRRREEGGGGEDINVLGLALGHTQCFNRGASHRAWARLGCVGGFTVNP